MTRVSPYYGTRTVHVARPLRQMPQVTQGRLVSSQLEGLPTTQNRHKTRTDERSALLISSPIDP
jgi:hypothetical protein